MYILVINAGSSTIKFELFDAIVNEGQIYSKLRANYSRVSSSRCFVKWKDFVGKTTWSCAGGHINACKDFINKLSQVVNIKDIDYIAFRVVHGGEYKEMQSVPKTKVKIFHIARTLTKAHAEGLIATVKYFQKKYAFIPQYFDFDTLYHKDMEKQYYTYALPKGLCKELKIRKFGEHGLSHQYIAVRSSQLFGENQVVISCHLGSGSSITCMYNGKCIDNSMGLTPLAGVIMGTRCGNIDPSIITYIMKSKNITPDQMDDIMNLESGLKGICGQSDMATVIAKMAKGNSSAKLAFDVAINSYVKAIGGKILQVGDLIKTDLSNLKIVFTAGIGENSPLVRQRIIDKLSFLNIKLDETKNKNNLSQDRKISSDESKAEVWIIPTNEEVVVATDLVAYLQNKNKI